MSLSPIDQDLLSSAS
jgi:hypothetical protein